MRPQSHICSSKSGRGGDAEGSVGAEGKRAEESCSGRSRDLEITETEDAGFRPRPVVGNGKEREGKGRSHHITSPFSSSSSSYGAAPASSDRGTAASSPIARPRPAL